MRNLKDVSAAADNCQPSPAKPRRIQFTIFDMLLGMLMTIVGIEYISPLIVERYENRYFHPIVARYYLEIPMPWLFFMIAATLFGAGIGVWRASQTNRSGWARCACTLAGVLLVWAIMTTAVIVPHWIPPRRMATCSPTGACRCKALCEAQEIYRREDRNRDGILGYARTIKELQATVFNGNPLVSRFEGDSDVDSPTAIPLSDVVSKLLTAQGPHAIGGERSFIVLGRDRNERMSLGYAFVVCPSIYGENGKVSYAITFAGTIYECDLGPNTRTIVHNMTVFDPDPARGWKPLE